MNKQGKMKLVRLYDFNLVPDYLFEQVKNRNWETEKLKQWGPTLGKNPFTLIYGVMENDKVCGVIWANINPVSDGIFINIISVDPKYQDGRVVQRIVKFFRGILSELGLSKIYALTSRTKAGERLGWKRTGNELMEV